MKFYLQLLKFYYKTISYLSPKLGGTLAFKLFQKVRKKNIRSREQEFYAKAKHFRIPFLKEDLNCYELGDAKGELIFLVHGWDSNAGSLSRFAFELAEMNYRVISFDLPAHAKSKSKYTNLYECKEAFKVLLNFITPKEPFTVVAHSFGSAVSAYALSSLDYKVDKFIFLTSPNSLYEVFNDFKKMIDISDKSFSYVLSKAKSLLNEDVRQVNVAEKLGTISFSKLLLVHDTHDKIIPFRNSEKIKETNYENAELKSYTKIGHYRMLWNDDVLKETVSFIKI